MPCSDKKIEVVSPHPPPPTIRMGTVMSAIVHAPPNGSDTGCRRESVPHLPATLSPSDQFVGGCDEPLGLTGPADPARCAGEDQITRSQRQDLREIGHEPRNGKDQIRGAGPLHDLARQDG